MKKITFLFAFVSALALTSCSSDDDGATIEVTNQISYAGTLVDVSSTSVEDYGTTQIEGHYNLDFYLNGTNDGIAYEFYVELFSPITGNEFVFTPGTFSFLAETPETPAFHFDIATLRVDGVTYDAVGGTVTISGGENNNYTIVADIQLDNNEMVTVSFSGTFTE
ncbi:hypothetical protein [Aquimarina rubra]|uniref:Lipocalin-like domain-containing protein n=1 Tax=Aquimarina rubra TaxID=1920033 RepID=A0ABW5LBL3_9FLAO